MSDLIIARRYARALYEQAQQDGVLDAVDADMAVIRETLEASRDLNRFFRSPIISREKKQAVVTSLVETQQRPTTLRFLELLVDKKREDLVPEIVAAYRALRDEQEGVVEAHVKTALPLSDEEERTLTTALERMTEQKVRLDVERDPELVGGVVIRVGDTVYDGSVRNKLANLREQLEHGTLHAN